MYSAAGATRGALEVLLYSALMPSLYLCLLRITDRNAEPIEFQYKMCSKDPKVANAQDSKSKIC